MGNAVGDRIYFLQFMALNRTFSLDRGLNPSNPRYHTEHLNSDPIQATNEDIDEITQRIHFLVVSVPNNQQLTKSPFVIEKALRGISGSPKSAKKLRSGNLLLETSSACTVFKVA